VAAGDPALAVATALRAAAAATDALAPELAVAHLAGVLAEPRWPEGIDEVEVLLALAEAKRDAGDWDGGGDAFESAARLAAAAGRTDQLTRAALGFGAGLSGFEIRLRDQRQIDLLRQAADALVGSDSSEAVYVTARLAVALYGTKDADQRTGFARGALDMAERLGDPGALGAALAAWADQIAGPDHVDERLSVADRIVDAGRASGNRELELLGRRFRVVALLERGDLAAFDREVGAFAAGAAGARLLVRWYVPLWRGLQALLAGRVDDAMERVQETLEMAARADSTNGWILASSLRLAIWDQAGVALSAAELAQLEGMLATLDRSNLSGQERGFLLALALLDEDPLALREHLDALLAQGLGERDAEFLGTVTTAARASVVLGDRTAAATVAGLLEPYRDRWVVDGIGAALLGTVEEHAAALALLCGSADAAQGHAASVAAYDRLPAPLLAARARGWPAVVGAVVPGPEKADGASPAPDAAATLRREGSTWLATFDGTEARLADSKGVRDCAVLLAAQGRELHVLELHGGVASAGPQALLDDSAVAAYRSRIIELQADVDAAEADNDIGRAARAEEELDAVLDELQRSLGLGGRARPMRDEHERARQAVRARIRYAIQRIQAEHPRLGRHLEVSIRTGTFCSYRPERPVTWKIQP
jgi:hypothetical protein